MSTQALVRQSTSLPRSNYILFSLIALVVLYVLWHNAAILQAGIAALTLTFRAFGQQEIDPNFFDRPVATKKAGASPSKQRAHYRSKKKTFAA